MNTVLLTGGTGFIGGYVARELAARGIAAVVCGHRQQVELPAPLQYVSCNLLDEKACRALCGDIRPSHLLHLAWDMTPDTYHMGKSNIAWLKATLCLAEVFCQMGGKRFVGGGTCHEYMATSTPRNELITPVFPETMYGAGKIAAFYGVRAICRAYQTSMAWGRMFSVFGPGDASHRLLPGAWHSVLHNREYAIHTGDCCFDFIDVRDAASMLVTLLLGDIEGAVNIGTGIAHSARDCLRKFFRLHHKERLLKDETSSSSLSASADMTRWNNAFGPFNFTPLMKTMEEGLAFEKARLTLLGEKREKKMMNKQIPGRLLQHISREEKRYGLLLKAQDGTLLAAPLFPPTGAETEIPLEWEKTADTAPSELICHPSLTVLWKEGDCEILDAKMSDACMEKLLRQRAIAAARLHHEVTRSPRSFVPGTSPVPVSGKLWGAEEVENLINSSLDFWLTAGRYADAFEKRFTQTIGRKHALAVNSGSSANLLAIATLCSPCLKERRLKPGDEVITVAAGFPTTVAPIVQHSLIPVFVDVTPPTYNIDAEQLEAALSPRTRAIFLPHTLGNPFNLAKVMELAHKHELWVVEDACDALGAEYALPGEAARPCGSFGHLATFSFYPAHHITMGEGGAVVCNDPLLYKTALSLRDWGRDCWCAPGKDDTCKRRYQWKFPLLPDGYDHKYVYSQLGYNLKVTDMQAAIGVAQLDRLEEFVAARRRNYRLLYDALSSLNGDKLILPEPTPCSQPSWFGFLITLAPDVDRRPLLEYLNERNIGTRLLFAGNMLRQPCFEGVNCRVVDNLSGTDTIMNQTFWVGVGPLLHEEHIRYMAESIIRWICKKN